MKYFSFAQHDCSHDESWALRTKLLINVTRESLIKLLPGRMKRYIGIFEHFPGFPSSDKLIIEYLESTG